MNRIIAFAVFWVAVGMLLMLLFKFKICAALFAIILLAASWFILAIDDWW